MYRARTLTVLAVLALTGCATAAQRQFQNIRAGTQASALEFKACVTAIAHKPEYALLLSHTPDITTGQPTMRQLTDETVPTEGEAKLLVARHDEMLPCRQSAISEMSNVAPAVSNALVDGWTRTDAIVLLLAERKITWAEGFRRSQGAGAETRAAIHAADREITDELRAEHDAEMARRQAAGAALMQWSADQQLINAINRPTMTTCSAMGTFTNCVSH